VKARTLCALLAALLALQTAAPLHEAAAAAGSAPTEQHDCGGQTADPDATPDCSCCPDGMSSDACGQACAGVQLAGVAESLDPTASSCGSPAAILVDFRRTPARAPLDPPPIR
jgi:hypothetical protein